MFIRRRVTSRGTLSCQIIESYRQGKKVRQKVIFNLGPIPNLPVIQLRIRAEIDYCEMIMLSTKLHRQTEEHREARARAAWLKDKLALIDQIMAILPAELSPMPDISEDIDLSYDP